jgi:hypothetical protein
MITRDLNDEQSILIRQPDHADLAAQFASHWGNANFARADRFDSLVFATGCHDDHFRDVEALLPIDIAEGRPYGHRTTPYWPPHLDALEQNVAWLNHRNPYAAILVSMHHTGLAQNRYGRINFRQNRADDKPAKAKRVRPGTAEFIEKMESGQRAIAAEMGLNDTTDKQLVWFNYRLLQLFDLLSLYLCCDGYADGRLAEATIGPIPVAFGSDREVDIRVIPGDDNSLRMDPYPFDRENMKVSVMGRIVPRLADHAEAECQAEYRRSPRQSQTWTVTK